MNGKIDNRATNGSANIVRDCKIYATFHSVFVAKQVCLVKLITNNLLTFYIHFQNNFNLLDTTTHVQSTFSGYISHFFVLLLLQFRQFSQVIFFSCNLCCVTKIGLIYACIIQKKNSLHSILIGKDRLQLS